MDLSSVIENLSDADMEKLRQTAASLFGAGGAPSVPSKTPGPEAGALALPGLTPQMLSRVASISTALSQKDPRSDFILALKPLLSVGRQKKADEAAMMIRLLGVLGAMKEEKP